MGRSLGGRRGRPGHAAPVDDRAVHVRQRVPERAAFVAFERGCRIHEGVVVKADVSRVEDTDALVTTDEDVASDDYGYSEEEEESVRLKLEALGYL